MVCFAMGAPLKASSENQTCLFLRQLLTYADDMRWIWRMTEPIGFVMERKMLMGIKRRVNRMAQC